MTSTVSASQTLSARERFKDAVAVACVALLLGIPMIGLTTVDKGGMLQVASRWPALFAFVAATFIGRLVLRLAIDSLKKRSMARERKATAASNANKASGRGKIINLIGWLALGIALALPIAYSDNRYVVDTATTVLIYVMLGWGLNVVVGLAGLLDLGYVAF